MNALGLAAYGSSSEEEEENEQQQHMVVELPVAAAAAAPVTGAEEDAMEAALARAGIPPAAPSSQQQADEEVQERIRKYITVQQERSNQDGGSALNFQGSLCAKKDVNNPYILEKVVEYFGIDELQSNFAPHVFDPHGMPLHEYSDAIALAQKKQDDERLQRQQQQLMAQAQQLSRHLPFVPAKTK
uniref:Uncharacterized protein n=1 Tax=Globisporangium ultimum (strain ATCC 200006 / CBS 805.95 / DAOM BR144) TaxID=431595 RepID=K3WGC2_GLOUD